MCSFSVFRLGLEPRIYRLRGECIAILLAKQEVVEKESAILHCKQFDLGATLNQILLSETSFERITPRLEQRPQSVL